jgi:hypothetical protein
MDNCRDEEDCPSKECKGKNCPEYQAPLPLDILATLADFIPKINQICDQLHAKSLVLEDDYCKAGDKANAIFDLCGELQADYIKIVDDESEFPDAKGVPMDHNG